jgi:hypothetical protein
MVSEFKIDYDDVERIKEKVNDFLNSPYESTQFTIFRSEYSVFSDENMKFVFDFNFNDILVKRLNKPDACTYIMEVLRDENGNRKRNLIIELFK